MKTDWKVGEEMKRIGTRIVLAVLFCSILMSLLLGGFSTIRIISVIRKESKENLLQLTRVYGKTLDELLVSEETGNATKNISDILNNIQAEIETAKENMNKSEKSLEESNKTLQTFNNDFQAIYIAILETIDNIKELENRLDEINKYKDEVVLTIENISAVTEETASSTEELSASMEEQAATMETISHNTDNLVVVIQKLEELVNRFKI